MTGEGSWYEFFFWSDVFGRCTYHILSRTERWRLAFFLSEIRWWQVKVRHAHLATGWYHSGILAFCHDHFVREKNTSALILWNSTRSIPLFILSHIHMIAKRKQDHLQYKFLFEVSYHSIRRGNKWSELLFRCQAAVLQQNAVWGLPASGDGNYSQHTVKHGITSASACAPQVLVCQSSRKRTTRHKEGSPRRQNQEELLMKCETLLEARVAEVKCGHTARTRTARAVAWCFRYLTSSLAQSRHGEVYNSKGNFLNRRFSMAKRVEYEQIQS